MRVGPNFVYLFALLVAVASGFLTWITVSNTGYSLIDAYKLVIDYASKGVESEAFKSGLGALILASALRYPDLLIAFVTILAMWPASIVSGLTEALSKSVRPHPSIYGFTAFFLEYFFSNAAYARGLALSPEDRIGLGAWLMLLASVTFIMAYVVAKWQKKRSHRNGN